MTYSIVARDPQSGQMGVAVQSHYFSTGSVVCWAEPGVGAVATQSMVDISYGPLGLALLRAGKPPADALAGLTAADPGQDRRQVAMVDNAGLVATHTGEHCIAAAGHRSGPGWSVQANMMTNDTVWDAMAKAYESTDGDLADRMLAALDAAEAEGGDIRGRQSAAMVIVGADATAQPWERVIDVRVDDHAEPLVELRRLVDMRRAYLSNEHGPAMGGNPELVFWRGLALGMAGQVDEARPLLEEAYRVDDLWRELLRRLPAAGLFPDDPDLISRLT